jgi:hypothetical protein
MLRVLTKEKPILDKDDINMELEHEKIGRDPMPRPVRGNPRKLFRRNHVEYDETAYSAVYLISNARGIPMGTSPRMNGREA